MSFKVRRLDQERRSSPVWKPLLIGALSLLRPVTQWMLDRAKQKKEDATKAKRVHMLKKVMIVLCSVLLAFVLLAGVAKGLIALRVLSVRGVISVTAGTLPTDTYGHTNILLLGAGDVTHDGVDLTDSIMIASIDPTKTKSVALLSLPRDLYFLKTAQMGVGRINSLYRDYKYYLIQQKGMDKQAASMEALRELAKELGTSYGVEIHHVIKVDFIAFVQAVDALGGIDVVVPEDLVDTQYPGPNYSYTTFALNAGPQHLDGETALKYARSRHSTSDFDRSARQQQIIKALSDKVKNEGMLTNPNKILSLLRIIQEHVDMTIDLRGVLALAKAGLDVDPNNILSLQLNSQNGLYSTLSAPGGLLYPPPREEFQGASVLLPVSIPASPITWKQIKVLTHLFLHMREPYVARRPIVILNAGAKSGSANRLAGELRRFGFLIDRTENADIEDQPQSWVASIGIDPTTETFLAQLLKMDHLPLPSSIPSEKRGPITIIIGEDYQYTPLQDLVTLQP